MESWRQYQHEVAEFYRGLGLQAHVDVQRVSGVRADHDVDVLVSFNVAGVDVKWIVECKQWSRPIPKERVLQLESVVRDIGADRGILVTESGFQAGAFRAATNNNITLTSLSDLRENATEELARIAERQVADRIARASVTVSWLWEWASPLVPEGPFNVNELLEVAGPSFEMHSMVLPRIIAGSFPISVPTAAGNQTHSNPREAMMRLPPAIGDLEVRVSELTERVRQHGESCDAALAQFSEASRRLFEEGRRGELPEAFVIAMKELSAAANSLINRVPTSPANVAREIMRLFIDEVYELAITNAPGALWEELEQRVGALFVSAAERLECSIRPRPQ